MTAPEAREYLATFDPEGFIVTVCRANRSPLPCPEFEGTRLLTLSEVRVELDRLGGAPIPRREVNEQ